MSTTYKSVTELNIDLAERLDQIEDHPDGPVWHEARQRATAWFVRYHLDLPQHLDAEDARTLEWLSRQDQHTVVGVVHLALLTSR